MNISDFVRGYANVATDELIEEMYDWFYNGKTNIIIIDMLYEIRGGSYFPEIEREGYDSISRTCFEEKGVKNLKI